MYLPNLPIQLPADVALEDRFNDDPYRYSPVDERGLDTGQIPFRIPRLWNISLGALAGVKQFGYKDAFDSLYLPPPVVYIPHRSGAESVANTFGRSNYGDTLGIPALFVGWNPNSARNGP